jgi:hypothetical protein
MFRMPQIFSYEDKLIDEKGIEHKKIKSVKVIKLEFYEYPFCEKVPVNLKELSKLQNELAGLPSKPNAWRDAGIVSKRTEMLNFSDMDLHENIHREPREVEIVVCEIEFYHLN